MPAKLEIHKLLYLITLLEIREHDVSAMKCMCSSIRVVPSVHFAVQRFVLNQVK